jgi:hypothetical protein
MQNFLERRSLVIFQAFDICGYFACTMSAAYCQSFRYLLKPGEAQAAPTVGQTLLLRSNIITYLIFVSSTCHDALAAFTQISFCRLTESPSLHTSIVLEQPHQCLLHFLIIFFRVSEYYA